MWTLEFQPVSLFTLRKLSSSATVAPGAALTEKLLSANFSPFEICLPLNPDGWYLKPDISLEFQVQYEAPVYPAEQLRA